MTISPVSQTALGDQVATQMRYLIISRQWPAGKLLREEPLAEMFGVSRGPIREALRDLKDEGLLKSSGRSVVVCEMTEQDIDELFGLRLALEPAVLKAAMADNREKLLTGLKEPLLRMRDAVEHNDRSVFPAADADFHTQFFVASEHRRFRAIWEQYLESIQIVLSISRATYKDLQPSYEAHLLLYELIASGDADAVLAELDSHLRNAADRIRQSYLESTDK